MTRPPSPPLETEGTGHASPDLSIVVPVFNEEGSVRPLARAVMDALAREHAWELLLVDDGSSDGTAGIAEELATADQRVRVIRLARNYGQTAAMQAGFDHARGRVIVTMDGDLQNDPGDIPALVATLERGCDLVAGYRERRRDTLLSRRVPSWVANRLIRWLTGIAIRDNGCSLKAYRRDVLERMRLYSDLHRFIPAVAAATAGARIMEIPVRHHPRRFGTSKYGLSRVGKVLADLLTVKMIRSFRERPLHLFSLGAAAAALGAAVYAMAAVVAMAGFGSGKAIAVVFPGAAVIWLGLACYLLMLGLIAEVALREGRRAGFERPPIAHEDSLWGS